MLGLLARGAAAVLAATFTLVPPSLAATATKLRYDVWSGGARVLEVTLVLRQDEERYRVDLDALLVGVPSWFTDYRLVAEAEGRLGESGPAPIIYRQEETFNPKKQPKWLQLVYNGEGLPSVTTDGDPASIGKGRGRITEAQKLGSQDPLSAVLSLLLQAAGSGGCEGLKAPVYDGKRRFDLATKALGEDEVRPGFSIYAGPARVCGIQFQPVAGYRLDGKDRHMPQDVKVFIATLGEDLPPVPVRIESEVEYGAVMVHLVGITAQPQEP